MLLNLKERNEIAENTKLGRIYFQFSDLLKELEKKELPSLVIDNINNAIEELNVQNESNNDLKKLVKRKQTLILRSLEKQVKIVPLRHYRKRWTLIGMFAIGFPLGNILAYVSGNKELKSLGLPIGLVIGISIGLYLDKKAFKSGKQLNVEIKY